MHLERIDTTINMADHLTKALNRALFHRHRISFWVMFHHFTHLYINQLLDHIQMKMIVLTSFSRVIYYPSMCCCLKGSCSTS